MTDRSPEQMARRARVQSWVWWVQAPIVCFTYLLVSHEPMAERLMFCYLAFVSVAAMGATYSGKEQAAEARSNGTDEGD